MAELNNAVFIVFVLVKDVFDVSKLLLLIRKYITSNFIIYINAIDMRIMIFNMRITYIEQRIIRKILLILILEFTFKI